MANSTIERLRKEMRSQFTYLDVLALALVRSGVREFTGDSDQWSRVVRSLREDYPELLSGIWFTERGYSEQLEEFFRVMARSGALSFANPRFERIQMTDETAHRIEEGASGALMQEVESIDKIAERIADLEHSKNR